MSKSKALVGAALNTVRFIWNHPLASRNRTAAFRRFFRWQAGSRLLPGATVVPFIGHTRLLVEPGMTGATGNIYVGLHEFADMAFVMHLLRPGDLFFDIGANVGSYSLIAAGGAGASVVAIEPVPSTYAHLQRNVRLNWLDHKITALNKGAGREHGTLQFTTDSDTTNHVIATQDAGASESVAVEVITLDTQARAVTPTAMKIDVEGFESEVLAGASVLLSDMRLKAIVIELNGSGLRYGFEDSDVDRVLCDAGFKSRSYDPFTRALTPLVRQIEGNVIYVRDEPAVVARLQSAPRTSVLGVEF